VTVGFDVFIRHALARAIAPKVYLEHELYQVEKKRVSAVPRPMVCCLKTIHCSDPLVGVEIGVSQGENAESMLQTLNIHRLYLVDPYADYDQNGRACHVADSREIATRKLHPYIGRVTRLFMTSDEAVAHIPVGVDFVYIDGNHDYEHVKADIEHYYPLVRSGGIIGGHDFRDSFPGVMRAVNEFAATIQRPLIHCFFDWWIRRS
jgi:predicted O-methyltransferase YrrM